MWGRVEICGQGKSCTDKGEENLPQQICLWISSLLPTSPGWTDEVCSEFNTSQPRFSFGSELFHPPEMKQDSQNCERLQAAYKELGSVEILLEPKIVWLLIILTPTGSSWSSHTVRPKKENSRETCREDSLRETSHKFFFAFSVFFALVSFWLSSNRVKV